MAIRKFAVAVIRKDEYEVEIDDSIYSDEFLEQWTETFYHTEEGKRQEDFVKHLANAITANHLAKGLEGFGYVKQKYSSMAEGDFLRQINSELKNVTEEEYAPGLSVNIISYDLDYKNGVVENLKK
ncbi:MAG: hypothetical protein RLZZ540_2240 [Bacteroidota bacterium]|jgi:hypothetical protein